MANQPFYHLRPNKCIDRSLFVQTLIGLSSQIPIAEYRYTGFGSYYFDDFKLLHDTLNLSRMVSLEMDHEQYHRAIFNCPYGCIDIKNTSSTEYLSDLFLPDDEHNIFWFDFVSPRLMTQQLADYANLLDLLNPGDIVRITLNASPISLGDDPDPDKVHELRLKTLKERIANEYLPHSLSKDDITHRNYPLTLLKILKAITLESLLDDPPHNASFMLPLFSSIYTDGQQMLTFTGIVLDSHEKEVSIKHSLSNYPHNTFKWDSPCRISIPALTRQEITEINKLLPDSQIQQQLIEKFPFIFSSKEPDVVNSYVSYYKYYPNYHLVSF